MNRAKLAVLRWAAAPVAAALFLSACATPTPYQPRLSRSQGGYSEQRIEANRYRVNFVGNSLTSRERVENYLLYRAAEVTHQAGYNCFTTAHRGTDQQTRLESFGPYHTGPWGWWGPSWHYRFGGYWHAWDPWGYGPFWADDIDIRTVTSYEASAEIVLSRGPCHNDPATFDAEEVLHNLGPSIQYPERHS